METFDGEGGRTVRENRKWMPTWGMQNPANLEVSAEAMELAVLTYRATAGFPGAERFGLAAQMQRSAVSVGSNIAEGCGRDGNAALVAFLQIALGSASELHFQANLAARLQLGRPADVAALLEQTERLKRMLSRLIVALRARPNKPAV